MRKHSEKYSSKVMIVAGILLLCLLPITAMTTCSSDRNDNLTLPSTVSDIISDTTKTEGTTARTTTEESTTIPDSTIPDTTMPQTPNSTTTAPQKSPSVTPKNPSSTTKAPVDTKAPSATPNASPVQDIERQVVDLVNQARRENGLGTLTLNPELSDVARTKSKDMATNKYFSHTSPTYGSPFDMMKRFGITYRTAGENIAMGQTTAQQVFNGWMNSEGHRANILNPSFTQIGVGYVSNGHYWTQMFIG